MKQEEAPKIKKPAKIFVRLQGAYDNGFSGSAYDAKQDDMTKENTVEYLSKAALIQGLMMLEPKFVQMAQRRDATATTRLIARKQQDILKGIIEQIASM